MHVSTEIVRNRRAYEVHVLKDGLVVWSAIYATRKDAEVSAEYAKADYIERLRKRAS